MSDSSDINLATQNVNRVHRVNSVCWKHSSLRTHMQGDAVTELVRKEERVAYPQGVIRATLNLCAQGIDPCAQKKEVLQRACAYAYGIDPNTVAAMPDVVPYDDSTDLPTDNRLRRVHSVLANKVSPFLAGLSPATVSVSSPKGPVAVSPCAVKVAKVIHKAGIDACTLDKSAIFEFANGVLERAPTVAKPAARETAPTATKPAPTIATTVLDASTVVPRVAPVPDKPAPKAIHSRPSQPVIEPTVPVTWGLSVYSLLIAAIQIAVLDDLPGAETRLRKLSAIAEEYLATFNAE